LLEHPYGGCEEGAQVETDRPVGDPFEVVRQLLGHRRFVAAAHLREAGQARTDDEPLPVRRQLEGELLEEPRANRPWPDERHVAVQDVPELRQLVELRRLQPASHARVLLLRQAHELLAEVRAEPLLGVALEGSELVDREDAPAAADPLAAALAIPLTTDAGADFPGRDLIVFLAFCVVFATLVVQGLSLPLVIRWLGLEDDGLDVKEEAKARIYAAEAAMLRLDELIEEGIVREDTAQRLRGGYEFRRNRFRARFDDGDAGAIEERSQSYQRVRRELLDAERSAVVTLRNEGRISEEAMHRVQRDLDLEDSRRDV
jgi:hypothetical protein